MYVNSFATYQSPDRTSDKSLAWTCGNDKALVCKGHINNGAYGIVYKVLFSPPPLRIFR